MNNETSTTANFFTLSKELKKSIANCAIDLTKPSFTQEEQAQLNVIAELRKNVEQAKLAFRNNLFETCNINASISNKDYSTEEFRGKTMYIYSSEICTKLQKSEEELYNVEPTQVQNLLFSEISLFVETLKQVSKLFNINDYSFNIEFTNGNKFVVTEQKHDVIKRRQAGTTNETKTKTFELKRLSVASDLTEITRIGNYVVTCNSYQDFNEFNIIDSNNQNIEKLLLSHTDQPNELVKRLGLICFGKETERNGKKFLSEKFPLHFSYIAKS